MRIMNVTEAHNSVLFTVSHEGQELRALQLVERNGQTLYASSVVEVGDLVLVAEIPGFLRGPEMDEDDSLDSVSHIIVGLVPPSQWQDVPNYFDLVRSQ
ncbi:MAG: hypothetical protein OXG61_06450 [Chloroflexi bacterium]|nr:hypothetical protein [Chloroflexota bacterium]